MTLVLFPLSAHLLPGGIMPLRIFEPRYQRMIAESRAGVRALHAGPPPARRAAQHVPHRHPGAHHRFRSAARWFARHHGARGGAGAHHGSLAGRGRSAGRRGGAPAPWQSGRLQADQHSLAKALQDVFNDYPEYAALYPEPDWEDASWVAQRWLEVLPIPVEQNSGWWRPRTTSPLSPC